MSSVVNLVVVGDSQCGKTSILSSFFKNHLNYKEEIPSFDDYVTVTMELGEESVALKLRNTVNSEACRRFRLFWYMGSNVVLLCFAVDSPTSLTKIPDDWMPELRRICPDVPVILVGNKVDLRGQRGTENTVSIEEGEGMRASISAKHYVECSALTGEGILELFETAAKAGMDHLKRISRPKCVLL